MSCRTGLGIEILQGAHMRIVIVGTYPENGSKNIGDQLITDSLKSLISDNYPEAEFDVVWREDNWLNVRDKVLKADHVFFACLAMRPNMHSTEYPFLRHVVDSGVPFSVVSAGTSLPVDLDCDIYAGFSDESIALLREVDDKAVVFTTRGLLTQEFCRRIGLKNAVFSGDIAFYDPKLDGHIFETGREISRIIVSDPHRAKAYIRPLSSLISGLRRYFPEAEIVAAQHGVSEHFERFCAENSVRLEKIYLDKDNGLDLYSQADLHVGFRVHGHVSALKRRKYSYLLEQDGRGSDYAVSIDRKLSVPNYISDRPALSLKNLAKLLLGRPLSKKIEASISPVCQVLAMIAHDSVRGFERFTGLESQVSSFNKSLSESVKAAISSPGSVNDH